MALEYELIFNGYLNTLQVLSFDQRSTKSLCIPENKINEVDLYQSSGFSIALYTGVNRYLEFKNSVNLNEEKEIDEYTAISFRIDKHFDNLKAKANMLSIIVKLLNETLLDCFLIFNGDYLILKKIEGTLLINKKMDFWKHLNFNFHTEFAGLDVKYV